MITPQSIDENTRTTLNFIIHETTAHDHKILENHSYDNQGGFNFSRSIFIMSLTVEGAFNSNY